MARQVIESLVGVGEVYAGDVLLRAIPYQLSLWRDDDPTRDGTAPTIDGHMTLPG